MRSAVDSACSRSATKAASVARRSPRDAPARRSVEKVASSVTGCVSGARMARHRVAAALKPPAPACGSACVSCLHEQQS